MKWIPVELYTIDEDFIVLAKANEELCIGYLYYNDIEDKWYCLNDDGQLVNPTHFIPQEQLLQLPEDSVYE